jgi:hypothetical protein
VPDQGCRRARRRPGPPTVPLHPPGGKGASPRTTEQRGQGNSDLLERSISKEIAIELRLASELWAVEAGLSQISHVLMNLCLNAHDAMPDGGALTLETHISRILLSPRGRLLIN